MAFQIARPTTAFSFDPSDKSQGRIRDDLHLAFIRLLPSVLSGAHPCEACHIRYGDPMYRKKRTGKGQKPDDCWTVPMTREEHEDQHSGNEHTFWKARGIDPLSIAQQLYAVSGDLEAATKVIRATVERRKGE